MMLKGNDATFFHVSKPFIFVMVFVLFIFLKPLQTKLRTDIQMCLSILPGGVRVWGVVKCTFKDGMDDKNEPLLLLPNCKDI